MAHSEPTLRELLHALRSQLHLARGYAELLLEDARDRADDQTLADLNRLQGAQRQQQELLEQLAGRLQPAASGPSAVAAPVAIPRGAIEQPFRVLLVEDDPINRELMRLQLEHPGLVLSEAEDGLEALDRIQALRPDLIVLDLSMPRLDGYGVMDRLVAFEGDPPPVLILSGHLLEPEDRARLGAMVRGVLLKGDTGDELVRSVWHALREGG